MFDSETGRWQLSDTNALKQKLHSNSFNKWCFISVILKIYLGVTLLQWQRKNHC